PPDPAAHIGSRYPESPVAFERREIGPAVKYYPLITNVQIVDFDGDGVADILACDARRQCLVLCSRDAAGAWTERVLAEDISASAHATVVDLDRDGDRDLVVSVLGDL